MPTLPAECNTTIDEEEVLDLFFGTVQCVGPNYRLADTILTDADYSDWRFVDLEQATSAANVPRFYDLETLRTATTVPLMQPRNGFFTSPAFLANWETNEDNQFRVTTSQTLIVALGEICRPPTRRCRSTWPAWPRSTPSPARPATAATSSSIRCASTSPGSSRSNTRLLTARAPSLDRSLSRASFRMAATSTTSRRRWQGTPSSRRVGCRSCVTGAKSQPCDTADPEFVRVAKAFVDSGYDFKTLLVELMSSPLVTGASGLQTFATAEPFVSITRKQHLCQLLDARMGIDDACGVASLFAGLVPEDEFARGSAEPVQTAVTGLFHFAASEQLCLKLASKLVGDAAASRFQVSEPASVIDELTSSLMGLPPGHSRHDTTRGELQAHYDAVLAAGNTKTDALRSTFVVACQSPDVTAIGL